MNDSCTHDLALDLLQKFVVQHNGNYRVIDLGADVEREMTLADVWEFFDGTDNPADEGCCVISEMMDIQDESNHILKSNGWIVKKLN